MSHARCAWLAGVLLALTAFAGCAQEQQVQERKRVAYVVKSTSAKELAGVLSRHFKGVADIEASPDGSGNYLLISAPSASFDQVMTTLAQLDVRPRPIAIDVFIVELPVAKSEVPQTRPDQKVRNDLAGPIEEVARKLDEMLKDGQARSIKRLQLGTLEGQLGSLVTSANIPFSTSARATANGLVVNTFTYRTVGTFIKVTPHIAGDEMITIELDIQDSSARDPATLGTDEKAKLNPGPQFNQSSLAGRVNVRSGNATLAKDVNNRDGEAIIIVGARITDLK